MADSLRTEVLYFQCEIRVLVARQDGKILAG
jgi:hypothetical protein